MVFSFDIIIVMMVISYVFFAYKAGLHSQLRTFFLYVAPLIILYFVAKPVTMLLYKLGIAYVLRDTIFSFIASDYSNTLTALVILIALYVGVIFISTRVFKFFIRETMKERIFVKLGKANKPLGALLGIFNFYVLIYVIIVPAGVLKVASFDDPVTSKLIEYSPPFSRWGRAASSSTSVTSSVDAYNSFSDLFTGDSLDVYYETIFSYQKDINKKEDKFYESSFSKLSSSSQELLKTEYKQYYSTDLTSTNNNGLYRVLLNDTVFNELISNEQSAGNSTKSLTEAREYVKKYEGLVTWFADEDIDSLVTVGDNAAIINSFSYNYEKIANSLTDSTAVENVNNFYLAISVYDTFTNYLVDVTAEIGYDYPDIDDYDFTSQSLAFMSFISAGNNMSILIENFNEDYQLHGNVFSTLLSDLKEIEVLGDSYLIVEDTMDKAYSLSGRYIDYYLPIINYLDPEISALERIGVAALATELDVYAYMEDVPLIAAIVNDVSLLCKDKEEVNGVTVCNEGGMYKAANILSSAFIMNAAYDMEAKSLTAGYYDASNVQQMIDHIEKANKKYIYTDEFVMALANQIAFHETQYMGSTTTLLDYMIDVENLFTEEGIQVLIDFAEGRTDLFSQDFVNKLIAKKEVI